MNREQPIILWCTPYRVGGVSSFCFYLSMITGWPLVRLGKLDTKSARPLPGWNMGYHIRTVETLCDERSPMILGGGSWTIDPKVWERLLKRVPYYFVFHDSTELQSMPHIKYVDPLCAIVLREANQAIYPDAVLMPQPYVPYYPRLPHHRRNTYAVSTARIDRMKQSHLLVEANRKLDFAHRINMLGAPNRLYVYGMRTRYPELHKCKGMEPGFGFGASAMRRAQYSVDLTRIDGDGGGMQYTTLEAIDAGAIPVVSRAWMSHTGPAHCLHLYAVETADELVQLLTKKPNVKELDKWRKANRAVLETGYNCNAVRQQYEELMEGMS